MKKSDWIPTAAQLRILNEVTRNPGTTYNGHSRPAIERLTAQGLVTYEYDAIPHVKGNGIEWTEQFTVYPALCPRED